MKVEKWVELKAECLECRMVASLVDCLVGKKVALLAAKWGSRMAASKVGVMVDMMVDLTVV